MSGVTTPAVPADCFKLFTNTTATPCGATDAGTPAPACSGWSRTDAYGTTCRGTVCADATACATYALAYCAANSGNFDCLCLAPAHTQYTGDGTTLDYDALLAQTQQSPALSLPAQCLYPPCWANREVSTVIKSASIDCSTATYDPCIITGIDVNTTNSVIQNLNVGTIQCGNAGAHADPAPAGNRFTPFGPAMTTIALALSAIIVLVGAAVFGVAVWWRSRALWAARADVIDALDSITGGTITGGNE